MQSFSRFHRVTMLVLLAIFCGLSQKKALAQTPQPWITLLGNSTYELYVDADLISTRVPVTLQKGILPHEVNLLLLDVSRGNVHDSYLMPAFTIHPMADPPEGQGPAIEIDVDLEAISLQGTYNLILQAFTPSQPQEQTLSLQIVHPAASLQPVGTLVVDRMILLPEWILGGRTRVKSSHLILRETSQRSWLTGIEIQSLEFFHETSQMIPGSLSFASPPAAILPNKSASFGYQLSGDFPLGISKGAVLINAHQLEKPELVNFEVHTRWAPIWILAITLAGVALGYVGRNWLQARRLLLETREQGIKQREEIQQALEKHPDPIFQHTLTAALDPLNKALQSSNQETLTKAINTANQTLTNSLKDLNERKQETAALLNRLLPLTADGWNLPTAVQDQLYAARVEIEAGKKLLEEDKIDGAAGKLSGVQSSLLKSLPEVIMKWRLELEQRISPLIHTQVALPGNIASSLKEAIRPIQPWLDKLQSLTPTSSLQEILDELNSIHQMQYFSKGLNVKLGGWLQTTLEEFIAAFETEIVSEDTIDRLRKAVTSLAAELGQSTEPLQALKPARLQELELSWTAAVRDQYDGLSDEDQKDIEKYLTKRKYVEAARLLVKLKEQLRIKEEAGQAMGNGPAVVPQLQVDSATVWSSILDQVGVSPPRRDAFLVSAETIVRRPELTTGQVHKHWLAVRLGETILAGFLILALAFLLYAPTFVGTANQVAQVFFWAFSADVTLAWGLQNAGGIRK